nr:MAG TPA: hypothetical protein [Caudoviricetes sp.]
MSLQSSLYGIPLNSIFQILCLKLSKAPDKSIIKTIIAVIINNSNIISLLFV